MSANQDNMDHILDSGIVAIIRADRSDVLIDTVHAIHEGGISAIEITLTTPGALDAITTCSREMAGKILIGAGTVLDPETARASILAGAEFIVAPALNPKVIEVCRRYSTIAIPGALTPTEILTAWECGADFVKVFPATTFGPGYFRDIKAPLPQVNLIPTGGVSLENAGKFMAEGASAVAVGSCLVDKTCIANKDWTTVTNRARDLVETVRKARQEMT
ncbi:MAG: bifunctional 4-hydroxy-2-oxoglutarate aldolase/2-dehydro-3-deoxy-phosphogluconate aldolase [Candidatus Latescibacteria bacterium]|nr:bifunctional 4-hydroxy-2-oxoglutarate aldolase/2-dehydro-3-deoxy-phosphogluconate aldolase [Candidatus Latescibacterota bacterium]